jgi:protein TonB
MMPGQTPNVTGGGGGHPRHAPYRPPAGVPIERERSWGVPVSVLVHVLIIVLLLVPLFGVSKRDVVNPSGAGGPGPAGGGGGGRLGASRGNTPLEHVSYVAMASPAPTPEPDPVKVVKPLTPKVTKVKAPPPVTPPAPAAVAPKLDLKAEAPKLSAEQLALVPGAGSGNDGTKGAGPGSGGGVGTGVGTGRGSGEGPGTGGGTGSIYPATPEFLVMPALPVPKRVQGKTIVLRFTIDERGTITKVEFESSGDSGYDRQLRERFSEYRFRPAHKMDGTPVPSVYITQLTL